jgi:hypothetical protein
VARKRAYNHENSNLKLDFYLPENSLSLMQRQVLEFSGKLSLFVPETKRNILIEKEFDWRKEKLSHASTGGVCNSLTVHKANRILLIMFYIFIYNSLQYGRLHGKNTVCFGI